jgi:2-polyprenyl-3-methyl-5-hydroxy-6-metoxy-1,4-benzoquinol methylase
MPEAVKNEGSAYLLSQVGGLEEAERLRRQAAIVLAMELPVLLAALPQGGTFVDLGCGSGLLADAVARQRPDARVCGCDADVMAVAEAERVFKGQPNLSFLCRPLEQGPAPQARLADVAVLRLVLMHLADPVESLRAARRWVKPGGQLHVIEGDDRSIGFSPPAEWTGQVLDLMEQVQKHRGGSRRRGRDLKALFLQAGWQVGEIRQAHPEPAAAAKAFAQLFLPVARFHLAEAGKLSLAKPEELASLERQMAAGAQKGFERIRIPLYHGWAQ